MRFFARLSLAFAAFFVCVAWLSNAMLQGIYICQGPNCPQVINGVTLSGNTFIGGAASGTVVGTISVSMGPASPAFSGSLSLTGTNASSFQVVGSNLQTSGIVPVGIYQFNIVATQAGAVNSPLQGAVQVTGTTAVASVAISCGSSCAFNSGTAGTVGTASATLNSGSFTGTWSLATSGTDHAGTTCNNYGANFTIVSGTGVLSNSIGAPAQAYPGVCVVATQAGLSNSPYTQAFTVTGISSATFPLSVAGGILQTAGGTPYIILGDAPQAANIIPLCSAGNTYALCAPGGVLSNDTLPTNATFVAYAKDRQAQGFNSLWINITCESYTRCNNAGATQEGTYPFTTQLSGSVMSGESCPESTPPGNVNCWDLSTAGAGASAAYWTHIDGYFLIAAQLGMQVLANPVPTDACQSSANGGSFAYALANNYVNAGNTYTKITTYANFLANRYKNQPNIIWFLGNDYDCFETLPGIGVPFVYIPQVENSLYQFASTLKASDPNHLITLELNGLTASLLDGTGENGGGTNAWSTTLSLNGSYENQGPPYGAALMARALNSTMPVLFVEGDYQGEDIGNINDGSCTRTGTAGTPPVTICNTNFGPFLSAASRCGYDYLSGGDNSAPAGDPNACPFRERVQFWWHMLAGGTAGYVDGNRYTWTFDANWPTTGGTALPTNCHTISSSNNCLDTAANAQLKNGVAFLKTVAWYKLVPDVTRSGGGTAKGTPTAVASPFVTGCYGTATQQACENSYYIDGNHSTVPNVPVQLTLQSVYPGSGVASDGSFGIAYVPGVNPACNGAVYPPTNCNATTSLSIIVNDAVVNGGANLTAAWYDPTGPMTSPFSTICSPSGTACTSGSRTYTTPGTTHADGTADWVLLVSRPTQPLTVTANPSSVTVPCLATGGTSLTTGTTAGGDGNTVTFSMTGNTTDFTINSSTGVVSVASGGIILGDCGTLFNNTIIATQP